jgi:hypothetical protein
MALAQRNELAESWRRRLETGEPDVVIFGDGFLTISLRRHAVHVGAGQAMDVILAMSEVSVVLDPDPRLDWDTGGIEIDAATARALVAFGIREAIADEGFDLVAATA